MFELFKFMGYLISQVYTTLNFKILDMPIGFIDFLICASAILIIFKIICSNNDKGVI